CTPYTRKTNPKKKFETREQDYSSPTREVVQSLKPHLRAHVALSAGYNNIGIRNLLKPLIKQGLKKGIAGEKSRIYRWTDRRYLNDIIQHVAQDGSKVHSALAKVAKMHVVCYYEVGSKMTGDPPMHKESDLELVTRICWLLKDFRFTALNPETRAGLFQADIIHTVICEALFRQDGDGYHLARMPEFVDRFREYPDELIALATCAVSFALSQWQTGAFVKSTFQERKYGTLYDDAVKTIKTMTSTNAAKAGWKIRKAGWY
ncbi:hypothetical protein BKA62DRAFT_581764, partial [Auriculariales sp. MPI-PUGE-AT-0066]